MAPAVSMAGEQGLSQGQVNAGAAAAAGSVVGLALLGAAVDAWLRRRAAAAGAKQGRPGQPRLWVISTLALSYLLLLPGLYLQLFAYDLSILSMKVVDHEENTIQLVQQMAGQGMLMAATFITLYAMVVPCLKILLLILSQILQHGGHPGRVRWARRCVISVQVVSKWACPDMFAYILMMCLFRGLDSPPNLRGGMQLGLGFSCFTVFCIGSTASSLGLRVPEPPAEEAREVTAERDQAEAKAAAKSSAGLSGRPLLVAVAVLVAGFVALLAVGVALPVMELRMDMALLYERRPALKAYAMFIDALDLPSLMHQEVSGWSCMRTLAAAAMEGEVNAGLALVLYGGFTVLIPLLDMLALLVAACRLCGDGSPGSRGPRGAMAASRVLGKLSMLEVLIMGVVVIVTSMTSMRKNGAILAMRQGLLVLLGAELCHYLAAFLVGRAYRRWAEASESSSSGGAETSGVEASESSSSSGGTEADSANLALEV